MPLRLMQIFIPEDAGSEIDDLLESHSILGTWRDASVENRIAIHLLVPAEETEPIMDSFEQRYANTEGFHVVLFPVEAVLPRQDNNGAKNGEAAAEEQASKQPVEESKRISREELYSDISETLGIDRVFVAMAVLSSVVAAVGLLRDDVTVIIGAMVIAPLLGPNIAMALSTTLGDLDLLRRALATSVVGMSVAFFLALGIGMIFVVDPAVPSIALRTHLSLADLVLALAAGAAGTLAFTRGLSTTVIGVMVAVALMPPLVTAGMLLGAGHYVEGIGAFLLLVANVVCINLAGVVTFMVQGVRPRTWWEGERARRASRIAVGIWFALLVLLGVIVLVVSGV